MFELQNENVALSRREVMGGGLALGLAMTNTALANASPPAPQARLLSLSDAISTRRLLCSYAGQSIFRSPAGQRYLAVLIRADIKADKVVAELFSAPLASIDAAKKLKKIAAFSTSGLSTLDATGIEDILRDGANLPQWMDDSRVGWRWADPSGIVQVADIDLLDGTVRYRTAHPTHVQHFGAGPDETLIYSASPGLPDAQEQAHNGFAVRSGTALSLLGGYADGVSLQDVSMNHLWFIAGRSGEPPRSIELTHGGTSLFPQEQGPWFSPDGQHAIIVATRYGPPEAWFAYVEPAIRRALDALRRSPGSWYSRQVAQMFVLDVEKAQARPLWNAPAPAWCDPPQRVAWSPDSRRVAVGPTVLPPGANAPGALNGKSLAVIEVATDTYQVVPVGEAVISKLVAIDWKGVDQLTLVHGDDGVQSICQEVAGTWHVTGQIQPTLPHNTTGVRIGVEEGMNRPPLVVAQQGKRRAIVLDPNPQLGDIVLGRTEILHWADKTGRKWAGRLTYPASYKTSEHYPLVIQNHGFAAESQFSLYGPGRSPRTGPGWSVWLAQPLASLGIAVLQFGRTDPPLENRDDRTPFAYLKTVCDARAAAIVELTRRGIASERVGLQGFSASGRQVEYDLTFGEFPYAAAIIDDAAGHNYLRTVLDREPMSDTTGVMPYGDDLKLFMEHSPAFNIERIKTPIQFHVNGPGRQMILSSWELFSNLRAAGRVAELYVIPNVERGSHLTPNPRQLVNKQQRAIDWWRFWLQDYEDQAAEKSAQYSDWRRMREQARRVVR